MNIGCVTDSRSEPKFFFQRWSIIHVGADRRSVLRCADASDIVMSQGGREVGWAKVDVMAMWLFMLALAVPFVSVVGCLLLLALSMLTGVLSGAPADKSVEHSRRPDEGD